MATLYVSEYASLAQAVVGGASFPQVPMQPALAEQAFVFTTTTQSAAFNAQTTVVRLHTDAICGVTFGTNPTATVAGAGVGSSRMAANQTEYHAVPKGRAFKVAAVVAT
jgi:hypothetical protein